MEENIIPVIMFIIALLMTLWKRPDAKKKAEKEKKTNGAPKKTSKLEEMVNRLKTQMQEAMEGESSNKPTPLKDWEALGNGRKTPPRSMQLPEKKVISSEDQGRKAERIHAAKSMEKEKRREEQKEKKRSKRCIRSSAVSLRQAIVWSEILGPPVSLKDENKPW